MIRPFTMSSMAPFYFFLHFSSFHLGNREGRSVGDCRNHHKSLDLQENILENMVLVEAGLLGHKKNDLERTPEINVLLETGKPETTEQVLILLRTKI